MSLPTTEDKRRFVEHMFDQIAPRYDLVNRLMTFGVDRQWRRRAVRSLEVGCGHHVLDLGCGTGDLVACVQDVGASVVGVDISARMLEQGRHRLPNADLVRADAQALPFANGVFDAAVSGFALRNFTAVASVLEETARILKPGGRLAILEVHVPSSSARRAFFDIYFKRVVPQIGRLVSRGYAYQYLAASTVYLPSFPRFQAMLNEAGFVDSKQELLLAGAAQLVTARRAHLPRHADDDWRSTS